MSTAIAERVPACRQEPLFERYVGIDYSGADTPTSRQQGLRVFVQARGGEPEQVRAKNGWNWTRQELASWLETLLAAPTPTLVGIDHAFSFPETYFQRYALSTWDDFLADFVRHWPTDERSVESLRQNNARVGESTEFRLCERWTVSAKSVFRFDVQGAVAKSTHAGLPWLHHLRRTHPRLHFWPFDGWSPAPGASVVAEVYPSLVRGRFPPVPMDTEDARDARNVCIWLSGMDALGALPTYFSPPLTPVEMVAAAREGWILGVM